MEHFSLRKDRNWISMRNLGSGTQWTGSPGCGYYNASGLIGFLLWKMHLKIQVPRREKVVSTRVVRHLGWQYRGPIKTERRKGWAKKTAVIRQQQEQIGQRWTLILVDYVISRRNSWSQILMKKRCCLLFVSGASSWCSLIKSRKTF